MTAEARTIAVGDGDADLRLDRWLRQHCPELGHVQVQKLIRTGQVRVDGKRAKAGQRLAAGQMVRVPPVAARAEGADATARRKPAPIVSDRDVGDLQARVLHRDEDVIVIDKPAGLAVQGGTKTGRHLDGMLDALRFGSKERPRLVHRLDRDTSGVLVLARTRKAAAFLTAAFRGRDTRKVYWALVVGQPKPEVGRIDLALVKTGGRGLEKMTSDDDGEGKAAETLYRVVDHAGAKISWLAMEPLTGRTHQLRAHAAALGTPILGDGKYGGADARPTADGIENRLHLHARAIRIPHPQGGQLEAVAPLPSHMKQAWAFFGFNEKDVSDPFGG